MFCQHGTCHKQFGELYGPYFASVSEFTTSLPEFLTLNLKSEKNCSEDNESIDLWMHGDCAFWAPDLQLVAGSFRSLEKFMSKYWAQVFIFFIQFLFFIISILILKL